MPNKELTKDLAKPIRRGKAAMDLQQKQQGMPAPLCKWAPLGTTELIDLLSVDREEGPHRVRFLTQQMRDSWLSNWRAKQRLQADL